MANVAEILVCALAGQDHFHAGLVGRSKDAILGVDGWRSKRLLLRANEPVEVPDEFARLNVD